LGLGEGGSGKGGPNRREVGHLFETPDLPSAPENQGGGALGVEPKVEKVGLVAGGDLVWNAVEAVRRAPIAVRRCWPEVSGCGVANDPAGDEASGLGAGASWVSRIVGQFRVGAVVGGEGGAIAFPAFRLVDPPRGIHWALTIQREGGLSPEFPKCGRLVEMVGLRSGRGSG
jgi:hypothetical protein